MDRDRDRDMEQGVEKFEAVQMAQLAAEALAAGASVSGFKSSAHELKRKSQKLLHTPVASHSRCGQKEEAEIYALHMRKRKHNEL